MKNLRNILFATTLALAGCGDVESNQEPGPAGVQIQLFSQDFSRTRVVDADNLEVEQTIKNISVLLTAPSSNTVTHWFVNAGFSNAGDYRLVTLPVEPSELATRDIYVVTNYTDTDLSAVTTITDLNQLMAPRVDKTNNLDPAAGFSMYGMTADFDFTSGETADVYVRRACAKIRVTMTFPDEPGVSTDNEFLIANAAKYTSLTGNTTGLILTSDEYFNFAANMPLEDNDAGAYIGIAYVYAASAHPVLYLYTHLDGSAAAQEYSAELPLPERNHLYDCDVRIYTAEESTRSAATMTRFTVETTVTVYDENGEFISRDVTKGFTGN